jgi:hypothetical protein
MSNKKYETDGVPERLRQITAETLPVEVPHILDIDPYTKPQDIIYIDKTQADGMGRLVVDGRQSMTPLDTTGLPDEGTVILMSVWVRTDEGDLRQGVVADCRHYTGVFDVVDEEEVDFTDQEEAWGELDSEQHKVIIAAVIDYNENREIAVWGDPVFCEAAICMANMIDKDHRYSSPTKSVELKNKPKDKKKSKKSNE